jgi:hypothetical protein
MFVLEEHELDLVVLYRDPGHRWYEDREDIVERLEPSHRLVLHRLWAVTDKSKVL